MAEVKAVEDKYRFLLCTFSNPDCTARFKTDVVMQTHQISCTFNYDTTYYKGWALEETREVFGRSERKLFILKLADFVEDHPRVTVT